MDVDASKPVAIVTGANTGIGRETALGLAKAGMKVFLACRNADKAREAATYIRQVILPISLSLSLSLSLSCTMSFLPTPCVQCGKALRWKTQKSLLARMSKGNFIRFPQELRALQPGKMPNFPFDIGSQYPSRHGIIELSL
jgi:hypothetical protein